MEFIEKYLKPKEYLDSVLDIKIEKLKSLGIKAIIADIDDTLLPRLEFRVPLVTYNWIEKVKESGLKIYLATNGTRVKRLERIKESLEINGTAFAFKPLPFAFKGAISSLGVKPNQIAVIGDQILTDIIGGNILEMYTILVKPLSPETSLIRIPFRLFENLLIKLLKLG